MTGRLSLKILSCTLAAGLAGCASFYEIPIETPIAAKLDVSAFQRVFIAGFLAGGTDDVDGNLETVRLLRSQLRMKSNLRVIDADVLPLMEVAANSRPQGQAAGPAAEPRETPQAEQIKNERDLQPYEHIFADADYWKRIGEEYQNPLIVTGTVLFTPHSQSGMVQREREVIDPLDAAASSRCASTWSARVSSCRRSSSSSTAARARRSTLKRCAKSGSTTRTTTRLRCRPTSS